MINPEILSQSKYQTRIIPISFEGTDNKVILAGSPISSKGVFANDGTAAGILLDDVSRDYPIGEIVIDGFVDFAVAQNHAGIEYTKECMTALKNIVFEGSEDKWVAGGSGGAAGEVSWNDIKDKPFYKETKVFSVGKEAYDSENENNGTLVYYNNVTYPIYYVGDTDIFTNIVDGSEVSLQTEELNFPSGVQPGIKGIGILKVYPQDEEEGIGSTYIQIVSDDLNMDIFQTFEDDLELPVVPFDGNNATATFPKAGVYVRRGLIEEGQYNEAYVYIKTISCIISLPLDTEFLPKIKSISDVTAAPTAEQFNALLAALRAAGYMAE